MKLLHTRNLSDDIEVEEPREEEAPLADGPVVLAATKVVDDGGVPVLSCAAAAAVGRGVVVPRHGNDGDADGSKGICRNVIT